MASWVLAAALAATPALRAAGWVWVPCAIGGVLLVSLAAAGGHGGRQVALGLLAGVGRAAPGLAVALSPAGRAAADVDRARLGPAVRGGALACLLLAVFVPLFTSADAAFAEILDRAVPSEVPVDRPVGRALALLAVLAGGGSLLLAAARGPARHAKPPRRRLAGLEWALPLGSLVALFAAFVAVQITTLFGGHDHVLRTTGLTYAEYAREGFLGDAGALVEANVGRTRARRALAGLPAECAL